MGKAQQEKKKVDSLRDRKIFGENSTAEIPLPKRCLEALLELIWWARNEIIPISWDENILDKNFSSTYTKMSVKYLKKSDAGRILLNGMEPKLSLETCRELDGCNNIICFHRWNILDNNFYSTCMKTSVKYLQKSDARHIPLNGMEPELSLEACRELDGCMCEIKIFSSIALTFCLLTSSSVAH